MIITDAVVETAALYLTEHDPHLAPVIARAGLCPIRPGTDYYQSLVSSIISQQLSVKAAHSIKQRFNALFDEDTTPSPEAILAKTPEELRSVGFSGAKVKYVRDLAKHVIDGRLTFDRFDSMNNDEIIQELVAVKGIGEWTAHMFLMFTMGRSDILPVGDLGIRNGVRALYGFEQAATPADVEAVAEQYGWAPYQTIASWYIWHSLDNAPA